MEKQLEKNMGNEMETGVIGFIGVIFGYILRAFHTLFMVLF